MQRKLTITVSDEVYRGLHDSDRPGRDQSLHREPGAPHVLDNEALEAAYREMAADAEREREAMAWIEAGVDEGLEA